MIVSSAPQIRFPDCYGIDMAKMGDFIAFQAAVELLKDNYKENCSFYFHNTSVGQGKTLPQVGCEVVSASVKF